MVCFVLYNADCPRNPSRCRSHAQSGDPSCRNFPEFHTLITPKFGYCNASLNSVFSPVLPYPCPPPHPTYCTGSSHVSIRLQDQNLHTTTCNTLDPSISGGPRRRVPHSNSLRPKHHLFPAVKAQLSVSTSHYHLIIQSPRFQARGPHPTTLLVFFCNS